jgi:5,10-methylene-tetrahydrofolate dehydrogenase/methenyl tetrahydrofolate cyclohydrolase
MLLFCSFLQFTQKSCEALNIEFELRTVGQANDPNALQGEGVEEAIVAANDDEEVGGILVRFLSSEFLVLSLASFLFLNDQTI